MRLHERFDRRRWLLLLPGLVLLTSFGWAGAHAAEGLRPHTAEYKVKISVVSGQLRTELAATDSGFVARHVISPTGMSRLLARGKIAEASEFEDGAGGFFPTAYRSNDTLSKDKSRADIQFDWDSLRASGSVNDEDFSATLEDLSYDRVSIQYKLMSDLLNGGAETQYRMFDVDKLKMLNVRSIGSKRVKVPAGKFTAVGVQHQAENSSRVTTLWCVEELGFLPVIIEQHRNGKLRVRATLKRYTAAN